VVGLDLSLPSARRTILLLTRSGIRSMACIEKLYGGFHSVDYGGHLYLVCAVCDCTEYKLSALQISISDKNTLNATTQQFITAKISDCALKQGSKTHSSLRQNKLDCANVFSNMSSRAQKMCVWVGWSAPRFTRSNVAKLHKN